MSLRADDDRLKLAFHPEPKGGCRQDSTQVMMQVAFKTTPLGAVSVGCVAAGLVRRRRIRLRASRPDTLPALSRSRRAENLGRKHGRLGQFGIDRQAAPVSPQ
jgi:hypothetical protein